VQGGVRRRRARRLRLLLDGGSELGRHRDSPGADTWGLAKVAANLGVNNTGDAVRAADALLAGEGGAGDDDTRWIAALGCAAGCTWTWSSGLPAVYVTVTPPPPAMTACYRHDEVTDSGAYPAVHVAEPTVLCHLSLQNREIDIYYLERERTKFVVT
jgi:hypothetical protein